MLNKHFLSTYFVLAWELDTGKKKDDQYSGLSLRQYRNDREKYICARNCEA